MPLQEARHLLDPIDTTTLIGLRDQALISVMDYSFAHVGAVVRMKVEDYYTEGRLSWFRLFEKGGKEHCVLAHHNAEAYVDAYLAAAGISEQRKSPLFRSISYLAADEAEARRIVRKCLQRRGTTRKRIGVGYQIRETAIGGGWI